jgi:RNA polymerase-binding transcription factor DksA
MTCRHSEWIDDLQERLQRELDDLYKLEEDTTAAPSVSAVRPLGSEKGGEGVDLEVVAARRRRIAQILRSFHYMEAGSYGCCATCGGRIERARLEKDAATDSCAACATVRYS